MADFVSRLIRRLSPEYQTVREAAAGYDKSLARWLNLYSRRARFLRGSVDDSLSSKLTGLLCDVQSAGTVLLWESVFNKRFCRDMDLEEFRKWVIWNHHRLREASSIATKKVSLEFTYSLDLNLLSHLTRAINFGEKRQKLVPVYFGPELAIAANAPLFTISEPDEFKSWLSSCHEPTVEEDEHDALGKMIREECRRYARMVIPKAWALARVLRCVPYEEPAVRTAREAQQALDAIVVKIDSLPAQRKTPRLESLDRAFVIYCHWDDPLPDDLYWFSWEVASAAQNLLTLMGAETPEKEIATEFVGFAKRICQTREQFIAQLNQTPRPVIFDGAEFGSWQEAIAWACNTALSFLEDDLGEDLEAFDSKHARSIFNDLSWSVIDLDRAIRSLRSSMERIAPAASATPKPKRKNMPKPALEKLVAEHAEIVGPDPKKIGSLVGKSPSRIRQTDAFKKSQMKAIAKKLDYNTSSVADPADTAAMMEEFQRLIREQTRDSDREIRRLVKTDAGSAAILRLLEIDESVCERIGEIFEAW